MCNLIMKSITIYINEKLIIKKNNTIYKYHPKTKEELQDIIRKLIEERGNEGDFNDIDTSAITDMFSLFEDIEEFNGDISKWDVSNVTSMRSMFDSCKSFNQDISEWNVSKVDDMSWMFFGCKSFNQDISKWNVSNVTSNYDMFKDCSIKKKYKPKFK